MQITAILTHLGFALFLALVSAGCVVLMIRFPILDHPDARKAHLHPTPKGGGVGVVVAFMIGMLALFVIADIARLVPLQFLGVILAALAMAGVALADDARDFRFVVKLAAQAGAAVVAVASGLVLERLAVPVLGEVQLGWFGVGLTLFWILGCTNAVNFMDGSDALVASVMLVASLALALISASEGAWFVYAASLFLAAGFAGFLPFNLPPARMSTPHRTHLYQMAVRAGVQPAHVAAIHAGFTVFHAILAAVFIQLAPAWKPAVLLPALAVQLLWAAWVLARMRARGLAFQ